MAKRHSSKKCQPTPSNTQNEGFRGFEVLGGPPLKGGPTPQHHPPSAPRQKPRKPPGETQPKRRINSRQKGAAGERELAEFLRQHGYPQCRRGQQRSGADQADIIDGPPGVHFECKRVESLNVWKAFQQAERDAQGAIPVVATRRSRSGWLAILELPTLLALLRNAASWEARIANREPGRAFATVRDSVPDGDLW